MTTLLDELSPPLSEEEAIVAADRCLECGGHHAVAPCVTACPADVDVPAFVAAVARGDGAEAGRVVYAENLLGGACARVCPVELLCDPADAAVASMHNVTFQIGTFTRNYWDFFLGFGYFVSVLMVFVALVAWQLGGLSKEALAQLPLITWGLAVSFAGVVLLSWRYFFLPPIVFSVILLVLLIVAAFLAKRG